MINLTLENADYKVNNVKVWVRVRKERGEIYKFAHFRKPEATAVIFELYYKLRVSIPYFRAMEATISAWFEISTQEMIDVYR